MGSRSLDLTKSDCPLAFLSSRSCWWKNEEHLVIILAVACRPAAYIPLQFLINFAKDSEMIAPTSDNVPYQYRCYRQNKSPMDKNEVISKSYRFLSPSIMTTGRKIGIAAKAKAEGKKKKKKKKSWCYSTKLYGGPSDEKCQDIFTGFEDAKLTRSVNPAGSLKVPSTTTSARSCTMHSIPLTFRARTVLNLPWEPPMSKNSLAQIAFQENAPTRCSGSKPSLVLIMLMVLAKR